MKLPCALSLLFLPALAPAVFAQCEPAWAPGWSHPGWNGEVRAFASFDDGSGSGSALYAGGTFTTTDTAVRRLARWNGATWSDVGGGLSERVNGLAVWDDGGGAALYAGGTFLEAGGVAASYVARWDGTSWSPLGSGTDDFVTSFARFDDGSGEALYVGGLFQHAGGEYATLVARWDGQGWSAVGEGLGFGTVRALAVHDDGSGPKLYAGGIFLSAPGVPFEYVQAWDGVSWEPVGGGVDAEVYALLEHDEGQGPRLFAGGAFSFAGGNLARRIARWDGASWTPLDGGAQSGLVTSLASHTLGGQPTLVAGGSFTTIDGQPTPGLGAWQGDAWTPLASGAATGTVHALALHDEGQGAGPALFAGGAFSSIAGTYSPRAARWQPSGWSALTQGEGFDNWVHALAEVDDGGGPALFAGGLFTRAGETPANAIARRTGTGWAPLGGGLTQSSFGQVPTVRAIAGFDDGGGPALFATGHFLQAGGLPAKGIARWRNGAWSSIGDLVGNNNSVRGRALAVFDDGTGAALYVGGGIATAGGVPVSNVARWDGAGWSAAGTGLNLGISYEVRALAAYDDGNGPKLYAAGELNLSGLLAAVARLDGSSWTALGLPGGATSLAVFDDGGGEQLYVGGSLNLPGVGPTSVARWNGSAWSHVPGLPAIPGASALAVHDDGGGPALYVAGGTSLPGGASLARWDGQVWSPVGTGVGGGLVGVGQVLALHSGPDALSAGGSFTLAGGRPSWHFAEWREVCPWTSVCAGDGSAGACPCGNAGASGHGCANSVDAAGAKLDASGGIAPDALVLASSGTPASALTVFFKGSAQVAAVPFGDGLRCAGGVLVRFGVQNAVSGAASYPGPGDPGVASVGGTPPGSGLTGVYQAFYRDPAAGFCPPATFNGTNALRVVW